VTGTITRLQRSRGVGTLVGEDSRSYTFRRSDVREVWFHDLKEGKNLAAAHVRASVEVPHDR
jgi:hypothetical protein